METRTGRVPAAQYLRMSRQEQEFSLSNQADAIAQFAATRNFEIVATYQDAGRSALTLKGRPGLQQLLHDVMSGSAFLAVLVFDVSRWGRFQNADESAHYEFVCRNAGVQVHYCQEDFQNDGSIPSAIIKALKRAMAAEYSRELSAKIYRGCRRLAEMGHKMGGPAPFGLRRLLLDANGTPQTILQRGERKLLATDHVAYTWGPPSEVETIRLIFRLFADRHLSTPTIARTLNTRALVHQPSLSWTSTRVRTVLKNKLYTGTMVWGLRTNRLDKDASSSSPAGSVINTNSVQPIVEPELFKRAERRLSLGPLSDEQLLHALRKVWMREGAVTSSILHHINYGPSYGRCISHFGSLRQALSLIGYPITGRQPRGILSTNIRKTHERVVSKLLSIFPERLLLIKNNTSSASSLLLDRRYPVQILLAPRYFSSRKSSAWELVPPAGPRSSIALCCLLARNSKRVKAMYLLDGLPGARRRLILENGCELLSNSTRLAHLRSFCREVCLLADRTDSSSLDSSPQVSI